MILTISRVLLGFYYSNSSLEVSHFICQKSGINNTVVERSKVLNQFTKGLFFIPPTCKRPPPCANSFVIHLYEKLEP